MFPPVGVLPADEVQFNDDMVSGYRSDMTKRLSNKAGGQRFDVSEDLTLQAEEESDSDDSVDFSLQQRRFQPLSFVDMRAGEGEGGGGGTQGGKQSSGGRVSAPGRKIASGISDSDSSRGSDDERVSSSSVHHQRGTMSQAHPSRALARTLAPPLAFSSMRAGSATQRAARLRDRWLSMRHTPHVTRQRHTPHVTRHTSHAIRLLRSSDSDED